MQSVHFHGRDDGTLERELQIHSADRLDFVEVEKIE